MFHTPWKAYFGGACPFLKSFLVGGIGAASKPNSVVPPRQFPPDATQPKGIYLHYYQFQIKSYRAATDHLTNEEDLAYRRLIEHYYDTEQPITQNIPLVSRRLRLGIPEVETILHEFFVLQDDGWHHEFCDEEIAKYHAYTEKQKANGIKGGRPKKEQENPKKPTGLPKKPSVKPITNKEQLITNNKQIQDTPSGLSLEAWEKWVNYRKEIKKPYKSPSSILAAQKKLASFGNQQMKSVDESISNQWQGLFEPRKEKTNAGEIFNILSGRASDGDTNGRTITGEATIIHQQSLRDNGDDVRNQFHNEVE